MLMQCGEVRLGWLDCRHVAWTVVERIGCWASPLFFGFFAVENPDLMYLASTIAQIIDQQILIDKLAGQHQIIIIIKNACTWRKSLCLAVKGNDGVRLNLHHRSHGRLWKLPDVRLAIAYLSVSSCCHKANHCRHQYKGACEEMDQECVAAFHGVYPEAD